MAPHSPPSGTSSRGVKRSRHFRRKADHGDSPPAAAAVPGLAPVSIRAQQLAALEEEVLAAVEVAVQARVEAALSSDQVQKRIMARLKEERAKLEEAVTRQLDEERAVLMQKRRKEQEEVKRQQEELERILQENRRKVERAQQLQAAASRALGRA